MFSSNPPIFEQKLPVGDHARRSQRCRMEHELLEDVALVRMPAQGTLFGEQGAQTVDATKRRVAPLAVGPVAQQPQLQLQLARRPQVVRIQEGDVGSGRFLKRGVSDRGGNSPVGQPEHLHARSGLPGRAGRRATRRPSRRRR